MIGVTKEEYRTEQLLLIPPQVLHDLTRDSAAGADAEAAGGAPSAADPAAMLPHLLELQRQTALMVNELLRHFWGCFPVGNIRPRLDKLQRVQKGLSEQYDKCAVGIERFSVCHLCPRSSSVRTLSDRSQAPPFMSRGPVEILVPGPVSRASAAHHTVAVSLELAAAAGSST